MPNQEVDGIVGDGYGGRADGGVPASWESVGAGFTLFTAGDGNAETRGVRPAIEDSGILNRPIQLRFCRRLCHHELVPPLSD